jgi:hypothetical protein
MYRQNVLSNRYRNWKINNNAAERNGEIGTESEVGRKERYRDEERERKKKYTIVHNTTQILSYR